MEWNLGGLGVEWSRVAFLRDLGAAWKIANHAILAYTSFSGFWLGFCLQLTGVILH